MATTQVDPTATPLVGVPFRTEPNESDRMCFNIFRTIIGSIVLGLTALFTILVSGPLVFEAAFPAPPSAPPTPAAPWTLWTEEDTNASRTILLISGVQASLIALGAVVIWICKRRAKQTVAVSRTAKVKKSKKRDKSSSQGAPLAVPFAPAPFSGITADAVPTSDREGEPVVEAQQEQQHGSHMSDSSGLASGPST